MQGVLFSVGEMLREHGDNIHLVVTAIGPGIHILAKNPQRPVPEQIRERVSSLAAYGVSFHACGNTMDALGWGPNDMLDFVTVVPIGAEDLMLLQATQLQAGFVALSSEEPVDLAIDINRFVLTITIIRIVSACFIEFDATDMWRNNRFVSTFELLVT